MTFWIVFGVLCVLWFFANPRRFMTVAALLLVCAIGLYVLGGQVETALRTQPPHQAARD